MELRGVEVEGMQMPPQEAMEPITYAGMSTRQVDFDMAREALHNFLYANVSVEEDFGVE